MNLATEPWIPVLDGNGEHRLVSLEEVFLEGDRYVDLAVRPHERVALMRLLLCVAQAALDGPADIDEWDNAPNRLPTTAKAYLEKWSEGFELFHPVQPFLQIAELEKEGEATPVSKLDFALATGNASTLFDQAANRMELRRFLPPQLALMLITYLNFSPGGLIAQVNWNGVQTSKSSGDAPCVSSSMYHSFVRNSDVLGTLAANLVTKSSVARFQGKNRWGRPVWETMPKSFDDRPAVANATETYLGRLAPLSRLVLLVAAGETMLLGNGLPYPAFPVVPPEPSATVIQVKNRNVLLGGGRCEIWRELPALIVKRQTSGLGGPLTLRNVPEGHEFDLHVGALVRKSGQAEVVDAIESVLHIEAGMQTDAGRSAYEQGVILAEKTARRLCWAIETYRGHVDGGWEGRVKAAGAGKAELRDKLHSKATHHFWTAVEKLRPLLLAHVETIGGEDASQVEESRSAWRKAVHGAALDAYRLACGQETPRQMRAFALGWARLFADQQEDSAQV